MLNIPSFTATFLLPYRSWFNMKYLTVLCVTLASMLCFANANHDSHWKCDCHCDFFPEPVGNEKNPGYSCKDIWQNNENARDKDGIYWITLSGRFPCWASFVLGFQILRNLSALTCLVDLSIFFLKYPWASKEHLTGDDNIKIIDWVLMYTSKFT